MAQAKFTESKTFAGLILSTFGIVIASLAGWVWMLSFASFGSSIWLWSFLLVVIATSLSCAFVFHCFVMIGLYIMWHEIDDEDTSDYGYSAR